MNPQNFKDHEHRYYGYDLELTVVVHALRVWRNYLLKKMFVLRTDHNSLTIYFKQFDLNSHQVRRISFSSEFDFDIQHLKRKENSVVDALRRKFHCI